MNKRETQARKKASRSMGLLKVQRGKLEQVSFRLKERDRMLFKSCIGDLENNKEKAAATANEIAKIRRLIKLLDTIELAIERMILRIETLRELGDMFIDFKCSQKLLQDALKELKLACLCS
jgi:division protein CdvB (Snf7/Vps24/ESCRT-III family)